MLDPYPRILRRAIIARLSRTNLKYANIRFYFDCFGIKNHNSLHEECAFPCTLSSKNSHVKTPGFDTQNFTSGFLNSLCIRAALLKYG